jgi:hypothetical protein
LCRVCEAKFLAEQDNAVGDDTGLAVMQPNGVETHLTMKEAASTKSIWKEQRAAPNSAMLAIMAEACNEYLVEISDDALKTLREKPDVEGPTHPESFGPWP